MNKRTLERCVVSLVWIRAQIHDKRDPRIGKELDKVIRKMALQLRPDQDRGGIAAKNIKYAVVTLVKIAYGLRWTYDLIGQFWQ